MADDSGTYYELRLYIFGKTGKSESAMRTMEKICHDLHNDNCKLEIFDLSENPELSERDCILATPTLIRRKPLPECRIIGDFSRMADIVATLDLEGS
jgi:circadian clock protein KaiB